MMWTSTRSITGYLAANHYLGPISRGVAWEDEHGAIVVSSTTSRRLPSTWLELSRWCLKGGKNGGSKQWSRFIRALRVANPTVTTIVSYSDPSQGHTGALYRACNWWWAPTWHRLRPPPSGNGSWDGENVEGVKDRWIFAVRPDDVRIEILTIKDEAIFKKMPWAAYQEPGGVSFKKWKERVE